MNLETQLYIALRDLYKYEGTRTDTGIGTMDSDELVDARTAARDAIAEFEMGLGPLPDWAVAHNFDKDTPTLGVQLCTKDGRRHGNAAVYAIGESEYLSDVDLYHIVTDIGSTMKMTYTEVLGSFYIGNYILDVDELKGRITDQVFDPEVITINR